MDFLQNFLKRKFTQVAIGEFELSKFEVAKRIYEALVLTYKDGFKGTYLLQEPVTDKEISVIFRESVEEMEAHQIEADQNILKKMIPLFVKAPNTAIYEVVCEI
jgi:hypothetical protein